MAEINRLYVTHRAIRDLVLAYEREPTDQFFVSLLVAASFGNHLISSLVLIRRALSYDAGVCLRSAMEALLLFRCFMKREDLARDWFYKRREFSPGEVRKLLGVPDSVAQMYKNLCDFTHPNLRGIFAFGRRPAPGKFNIHLGPDPKGDSTGLSATAILLCDYFYSCLYDKISPRSARTFHWLHGANNEYWSKEIVIRAEALPQQMRYLHRSANFLPLIQI